MNWLADLPVQRKLGYAMLLTSTVASLVACGIFLTVEYIDDRGNLEHTVATLARITADNSTAAIAFGDRTGARQNLEALRAEPQVTAATLFDEDGQVFAHYDSHAEESLPATATAPLGVHFADGRIFAVQPVMEGSRRLGTLHLQASLTQIYARMRTYALVVLGVLASSFGLAGLIASVLRRTLARPILELASTAVAVSARQDYSLRARQYGEDELGQLTITFNDMLQRTQAAVDGLRESEWAHRQLVRSLPTAACMCDAMGRITIFNEAAVTLWGRTPEIGREYWCGSYRIYRPDGSELPLDQCPLAVALRESRSVRGEEIIIERPDGTRRNVLPHPEPIRDTAGTVVGIVNMLVDITEQKRASAVVRQLAAIVESSGDAIIGKDLDGIITAWNRGAERLYGFTSAEMIGRPVALLLPPERENEEPNLIDRIRRNERIEHYETVRRRRDGTLIDVSLTVSPIKDASGRIIGASKIARDITEGKRAQQQADFLSQLSQQLSAFTDPVEIIRTAARMLGGQLRADRCYFSSISEDADLASVQADWGREGFASLSGQHRPRDFGPPALWRALAAGPLAVDDKTTHELTRHASAGHAPLRIGAHASVPFHRRGKWIAALTVATEQPRAWRKDELALLENALNRVWPMVERARTQAELRESERHQQKIAEHLSLAIASANLGDWIWDAATDIITLSPRTAEIYGVAAGPNLTRSGLRELLHPEDRERAGTELKRATATHTDYDIEYRVNRLNGTMVWVAAKGRSLLGSDGQVRGMVGVVQDITERKQHAEILRENEAQLRLVTDNAPIFLVRTDPQHRFTFVNRAYAERSGAKPADLIGRRVADVVGPDAYATFKPRMDEALAGARVEFEMEVPYERLGRRWVHVIYVPERGLQGQVTGLLGVISDIGARKQAEQELQRARDEALAASRAKDDFLAALSHELRTPLNPVLLLASDAAANPDLPASIRADFDLIRKNINLEARLIDDLLDLTRITRGKLTLEHDLCNLHTVLRDAIANVRPEVKGKGLQLTTEFAAKKHIVVGDSVRLQQVFWNVLKNAVKFTPKEGTIAVKTAVLPAGDRVTVTITDSGIGMTEEELKRAFEAFSQGDHASDDSGPHRFGGLGLGLAISKMLVDRHAGRIQAFSSGREQGSTFVIELPLSVSADSRRNSFPPELTTVPPFSMTPAAGPVAPRRILLVEDHAATRLTLQQLLRHRHHQVTVAESAARANQLASAGEFDLLISDVGLPDRSGYELMAELRSAHPFLHGIALSGYGMEEDLQRSKAAGFSVHLVKPVTIGMLEGAIASLPPAAATGPASNPPRP